MSQYTDEKISEILIKYEKGKKYRRDYYRNRYNSNEEHKEKCLQRSKDNYLKNKTKIQEKYQIEKELVKFKRNYSNYVKKDMVDEFIDKYPELWEKYSHHVLGVLDVEDNSSLSSNIIS